MKSICRSPACAPFPTTRTRDGQLAAFDRRRDGGFVSAPVGAVAMRGRGRRVARQSGRHIIAELSAGEGATGHSGGSHPEGAGLARSHAARARRWPPSTRPSGITVNAHATSTVAGDRPESLALHGIFTSDGAKTGFSSTQGAHRHGLSLAGSWRRLLRLAIERRNSSRRPPPRGTDRWLRGPGPAPGLPRRSPGPRC